MNFAWTEAAKERMDRARDFAKLSLVRPAPASGFDQAAWEACALEGITGMMLPVAWGGFEEDALVVAGVFEALGRGGADRGLLFALGAHIFGVASVLMRYGTEEQQSRWGKSLRDGSVVGALAVTEAEGGSSTRMLMTAEKVSEGFLLNGGKTYVTNAPNAGLFLVVAASAPHRGAMGLTAFLVTRESPGLTVEPLPETLGMSGAPIAKVSFQNVLVGDSCVLGKPGSGLAVLSTAMQFERTLILAGFLGAAERDLIACAEHLRARRGSQGTLLDHQAVAHRLARMKSRLESSRWLLYRGAWALNHARDPFVTPAMVKLTVSEALLECSLEVLRCFAGAGWLDEAGTATALRDVIGTLTASGTSDVQLNIIASSLDVSPS